MEPTAAGWQSDLFSETSDAATYCGIMNPELRPPSLVRNAGRPSDRFGLTSRSTRRSEMLASSATAIARASSANARGWARELALGAGAAGRPQRRDRRQERRRGALQRLERLRAREVGRLREPTRTHETERAES